MIFPFPSWGTALVQEHKEAGPAYWRLRVLVKRAVCPSSGTTRHVTEPIVYIPMRRTLLQCTNPREPCETGKRISDHLTEL